MTNLDNPPIPPLTYATDWIPEGRYMAPIVDGVDAYWVVAHRAQGDLDITTPTRVTGKPVPEHVAAMFIERLVTFPDWVLQTYGRYTQMCGSCDSPIGEEGSDAFMLGAHRSCLKDFSATVRVNVQSARRQVHDRLFEPLGAAWASAPVDRRVRALIHAGPITMEKLDATAARAEAGLPAVGMPTPPHIIRDRDDPRIPAWAEKVEARLSALTGDQLRTAFYWVDQGNLRHMAADLATAGNVQRHVIDVGVLAKASDRLANLAVDSTVLYAHVALEPRATLWATTQPDNREV
ncbi:hypothetical protein AB0B94_31090 [Micromonospora sp. NPDC048986]|uniref:hypothetical protein n=1 Tax=Micromonospora sp. NPDC048986 TaxID=3155644 RepID=UPI0033DD92F6